MKEQKQLPKTIKIGDCELDVPSGIVVDGDRSTRLDPKSVDVAIYLAEHADQLVTHDQLLAAVWPNKFVTESQLSKRITEIRQALGDDQKPHRYIETLPKRGYRLVCQCEIVQASADSAPAIESKQSSLPGEIDPALPTARVTFASPFRVAAVVVIVMALGYFVYANWVTQETVFDAAVVAEKSIAVLPFVDLSPNNDQQWYADGLAEEIINSLARLPELRVPSRTSSFRFRDEKLGSQEIASRLGVAYILEGSTRTDGDQLRATAQLTRADDGFVMWSDTYDDSTEAIFDVQKDIAESIAATLDVYLDDERREMMFQIGTRNVAAYEAYLQGMDIWTSVHPGGVHRGLNLWDANVFFARAMELDPGFAAAALSHSDAFAHVVRGGENNPSVKGDNYPAITAEAAMDWLMEDLEQAIEYAPNPVFRLAAQINREWFSSTWHRMPGLIASLRQQINSPLWNTTNYGYVDEILYFLGEHELLSVLAGARLEEDPSDLQGLMMLSRAELSSGNLDKAREVRRHMDSIRGNGNQSLAGINLRVAVTEGNTEEVIRAFELLIETGDSTGWNKRYLAAIQGNYEEANRMAIEREASIPFSLSWIGNLRIYHETENKIRSRELTRRIDDSPGGSAVFGEQISLYGNMPWFDLAYAPNFSRQMREAGIDPDSLKKLPRLSMMGSQ